MEERIRIERGKTVGIFGQKGTGKTYMSRQIAESISKDVIVFDTIGALKPKGTKLYEVDIKNLEKQAILFSQITMNTHHNIGVDFSRLTKNEIVSFTQMYLQLTTMKNKYLIVDEMADYTPQIGQTSTELERLVRHGRNSGNTFIFNTQRPAYLTKNVIALVDVAVFFRLVWSRDIDVVKDVLNNLGKANTTEQIREITNLGVGYYAIYKFGAGKSPQERMEDKRLKHTGIGWSTPKRGETGEDELERKYK